MRTIAIERQAIAHDEWLVVLTAIAKTTYKLIDAPSEELIAELKALRLAEQAAKARFELAMCDAMEEEEEEETLLVDAVDSIDFDQPTARIPAEVLAQLKRESR